VNPEREALWMPPGFMVLEGLVFKVIPFSLSAARTLSALFVIGAVACVFTSVRRPESKALFPAFAAVFLFCPIGQMGGNVARMEGLELGVLSLSFWLVDRRRAAALGLLSLAPIVHPNGLFGVAVGVPYFIACARRERFVVRGPDIAALVTGALAWALYAFHASQHWHDFLRDMDAQLRFKQLVSTADGGSLGRLVQPVLWGSALALGAAIAIARRTKEPVGMLGALLATLLVQTAVAAGWLYDVYPAFAVLVAAAVASDAAFRFASTLHVATPQRAEAVLALLLVAGDGLAYRHNAFLEHSLDRATVLRPSLAPEYITARDRAAVERYLTSITPPEGAPPLSVQFLPDAEALLYEKLRGPTLRYVQQTFYEHRYDLIVLHDSVWFPPFVRDLELVKLVYRKGGDVETSVIWERDGTEKWTVYRWKQP
jgi:hypothetical protein